MTIELLYPEVCNLYGDLMNVEYLARSSGASVIRTGLKDTPRFVAEKIDLVYMGSTTERGQELVRDAFEPWLPALQKRTEEGGVTLLTGNALEIFGDHITDDDGTDIPMLGWFPLRAERHWLGRYNAMYLGKLDDITVTAFKSQFGHAYPTGGQLPAPLFETVRGAGLNPDLPGEGVRIRNLMATYLIGPLLVLTPPFAKYVLKLMGAEDTALAFEKEAMEAYTARVADFTDPKRNFVY